jgi:hypothetical protein
MPTTRLIAPFLIIALASCAQGPAAGRVSAERSLGGTSARYGRTAATKFNINFDLIQRTCALYVAVRSSAWQESIAFGRDMDDSMVRWNKCPGGTMVACVVTPTADGDTVITGVPFTHGTIAAH